MHMTQMLIAGAGITLELAELLLLGLVSLDALEGQKLQLRERWTGHAMSVWSSSKKNHGTISPWASPYCTHHAVLALVMGTGGPS
mmetsp:Transcript_8369/g.14952  ORF Transcript_8369/g.14952 Transcript_8369/m.14952 type:complete len:85 (-) Transcript_8369:838-1092(-)